MFRYFIKRLAMMLFVLLGVIFLAFSLMYIAPGDPAEIILGQGATEEAIAALREELGLNDPFIVRYVNYVIDVVKLDFGISYRTRLPVMDSIVEMVPATLYLGVAGFIISTLVGLSVGIITAKKQYSLTDNITTVVTLLFVSMPSFWLGMVLVLIFSLSLGWFQSSGMDTTSFWTLVKSVTLPALSMGLALSANTARMTRSAMLEVIRQDYIDAARAKGITERAVTRKHMLRNALIPIITTLGIQLGNIVAGTVVTETVFSWPGLGRFMVTSIKSRDLPSVLGAVVLVAVSLAVVNLLVDLLYAFIDPRVKAQYQLARRKKVNANAQ